MPGTVLYLLLAAVIAFTHGNTLTDGTNYTAAADQDFNQEDKTNCTDAAEHELGQGDVTTILAVRQDSTGTTNIAYVKPKKGFEGVSVKVQDDDKSEDVWFPVDETCLPANGSWWKFNVRVTRSTQQTLFFRLYCGTCSWSCAINDTHITNMTSILVKGHGPSSWNTTLESCITPLTDSTPQVFDDVCEKPPTPTPPSTTTPQAAPNPSKEATNQTQPTPAAPSPVVVIGGTLAGGMVVVVVVVVVVCLRHRCRSEESQCQPMPTEPASPEVHDTRNSLYEPLSAFQQQPAAAPSTGENQVHVIENDLYESVDKYQQNRAFGNQ